MIYWDHNATTAPAPAVVQAMTQALTTLWGNPSSPHAAGEAAKRALVAARATTADVLGCKPSGVVFTSGATEANHLALRGLLGAAPPSRQRVLLSAVEHAGHLKMARALAESGVAVDVIPVHPDGSLDLNAAADLLGPDVAVVSLMAANNETGVLMPVCDLAELSHRAGALLHVDATQLVGKLPFDFATLGADAVSLSAHKFHGPKGVGALLLRQGVPLQAQTLGSQERARRGGTENLPGIVGLAAALTQLGDVATQAQHTHALREALEARWLAALPSTHIWARHTPRLPGTTCLRVGTLQAEVVLQRLGRLGVAAASGAACSSGGSQPSHVLSAMGVPAEEALAAVRLSLGPSNTLTEVEQVLNHLPELLHSVLADADQAPPLTPQPAGARLSASA